MQGREPQESQRQKTTYCQEIGPITSLDVQEAMAGIQPPPQQMQTRWMKLLKLNEARWIISKHEIKTRYEVNEINETNLIHSDILNISKLSWMKTLTGRSEVWA